MPLDTNYVLLIPALTMTGPQSSPFSQTSPRCATSRADRYSRDDPPAPKLLRSHFREWSGSDP